MCLSELLAELNRCGRVATESQIRWAIKTGKVTRPRVDASHRFDFSQANAAELATHFQSTKSDR